MELLESICGIGHSLLQEVLLTSFWMSFAYRSASEFMINITSAVVEDVIRYFISERRHTVLKWLFCPFILLYLFQSLKSNCVRWTDRTTRKKEMELAVVVALEAGNKEETLKDSMESKQPKLNTNRDETRSDGLESTQSTVVTITHSISTHFTPTRATSSQSTPTQSTLTLSAQSAESTPTQSITAADFGRRPVQ